MVQKFNKPRLSKSFTRSNKRFNKKRRTNIKKEIKKLKANLK